MKKKWLPAAVIVLVVVILIILFAVPRSVSGVSVFSPDAELLSLNVSYNGEAVTDFVDTGKLMEILEKYFCRRDPWVKYAPYSVKGTWAIDLIREGGKAWHIVIGEKSFCSGNGAYRNILNRWSIPKGDALLAELMLLLEEGSG